MSRKDHGSRCIPLLAEEGWLRHKKISRSHRNGADGVTRSASPIGRSLNRRPARPRFRRADHPGAPASIKLSRYPSSPNEQKQNAHEEIAFADGQKRNAHEEIPFADEQKRNAHEEIPFAHKQKRNAREQMAFAHFRGGADPGTKEALW